MNRVAKLLCVIFIPLLPGCASIDAFLFDANPDGSPLTTHSEPQPAAALPATGMPEGGQRQSVDSGKTNAELRIQNDAMKQELKKAEDELARLQKISHRASPPAVLAPADQLWTRIPFKSGQTSVDPSNRKALTALAGKFLAKPGKMHLEIKGYSDDEPVGGYNRSHQSRHRLKTLEALTQARADAVAAVMIAAGISANLVHTTGLGATGFVSDNSTAEGRSKNRRVDIHLVTDSDEESLR